jgi:hypothetical protein
VLDLLVEHQVPPRGLDGHADLLNGSYGDDLRRRAPAQKMQRQRRERQQQEQVVPPSILERAVDPADGERKEHAEQNRDGDDQKHDEAASEPNAIGLVDEPDDASGAHQGKPENRQHVPAHHEPQDGAHRDGHRQKEVPGKAVIDADAKDRPANERGQQEAGQPVPGVPVIPRPLLRRIGPRITVIERLAAVKALVLRRVEPAVAIQATQNALLSKRACSETTNLSHARTQNRGIHRAVHFPRTRITRQLPPHPLGSTVTKKTCGKPRRGPRNERSLKAYPRPSCQ